MRRTLGLLLLIGLAACSKKTGGEAVPAAPRGNGRVEDAAALLVSLFPSVQGDRFVCESPLQAERVPFMNCQVASDAGRLLDIEIGYGSKGPWVISLSGELVHTAENVALKDANGVRYGPTTKNDVAKLVANLQPSIETFIGRPLGQPELAMRRIPLVIDGKTTSAIVWTARYQGPVAGYLNLEPIGGSLIRAEF